MEVKRTKDGIYKIEGAKYVRIIDSYITNTEKCYELVVRNISSNYGNDTIFYTYKLKNLKEFLAQYETEKDLLADYYIARLEGKYELVYIDSKYKMF